MSNTYLYLLRRDKTDVKIMTILSGTCPTKKITNVPDLNLSPRLSKEIESLIYENRMMWEAWMESSDSISEFLSSLTHKGLITPPSKCTPIIKLSTLEKEGHKISKKIDPIAMHRIKMKD